MSSEKEYALTSIPGGLTGLSGGLPPQLPLIRDCSPEKMAEIDREEGVPPTVDPDDGPLPRSFYQLLLSSVYAVVSCLVIWCAVPWGHFFKGPLPSDDGPSDVIGKGPSSGYGCVTVNEAINMLHKGESNKLLTYCEGALDTWEKEQLKNANWYKLSAIYMRTLYEQGKSTKLKAECGRCLRCDGDFGWAIYYENKVKLDEEKKRVNGNPNDEIKADIGSALDKIEKDCENRLNAIKWSKDKDEECNYFRLLLSDVLFQRWRLKKSLDDAGRSVLSAALELLKETKRSKPSVQREQEIWEAIYDAWPWWYHPWKTCRIGSAEMKKSEVKEKIDKLYEERRR